MLFVPSAWRDIDRYYRDTWVKFQEFGDVLFYIHQVTAHEVTGKDNDDNDFILYLTEELPYTLTYVLPHRAVFQFKDQAYLLQRIPARQYKRGLSSENTRVIRVVDGKTMDFRVDYLMAYVNKQEYTSLKDALFASSKNKSVALGGRFSFCRLSQQLLVDSQPVAKVLRAINTQIRVLPLFRLELEELIRVDYFESVIENVETL